MNPDTIYFADTSFWVALANSRDQFRPAALAWYRYLADHSARILTSEAVLWEVMNGLSAPSTRGTAVEMYRRCHADLQVSVAHFSPDLTDAAVALYEKCSDKAWGLTDCSSFVLMRKHDLQNALTSDSHFEQSGFLACLLRRPPQ